MAKRETSNGDLRTPVVFFSGTVEDGLDGRDMAFKKVFSTFAEVYNPSMKDFEISKSKGVKASLTLTIRDPLTAYVPDNRHFVEILEISDQQIEFLFACFVSKFQKVELP